MNSTKMKTRPNIISPKTQYSKSANAQFQNASETSTPTNLLTYYFCKTCNISYEGLPGDPTTDSFIRTHSKKYIKNSKPKCHPEEMIKILKCQLHKCRHCSFSSLDFQRIVLHEKYKHNELTKQYKCRKCYKNQMTYVEYRSHFCKPEDVKRREILKKEAEENGEFSLCEFCGFATKKKKTLRYHIKSYHTERKFHCTLCKKKFVTELGLKKHLENHVDSESRVEFLCDYCRRSFKMKENLRNHIMGVHMHMKDSVCSICSKSFAKRNSLRQHLLLHSGKRPYICDICGKTFVQKPALTSHRKTHPGKLPPMPAVFIDSYIKEVDPAMVYQHVLPVPKLKTQSQKFEDFQ